MQVTIVEHHHHVLRAWVETRRSLSRAPILLTIDHHTDTSAPFRHHLRDKNDQIAQETRKQWLREFDQNSPESVSLAIERLNNDEHIQFAIATGIIDSAFVIAQNAQKTGLSVFKQHRICCFEVADHQWDDIIETSFLLKAKQHFEQVFQEASGEAMSEVPMILDIDLDAFKTMKSVAANDRAQILSWKNRAALLTIATEPDYVDKCRIEPEVNSSSLLHGLQKTLELESI